MNMEKKIQELLAQMTLEEKVGQLHQLGLSVAGGFELDEQELKNMVLDGRMTQETYEEMLAQQERQYHEDELRQGKIGSYLGMIPPKQFEKLQRIAVEESRLGIPVLFCHDVIHGFRTITPIPLGESCAWDPELWEKTARVAAVEASAIGLHLTFAPMVDVSKDARWGRVAESAGEDVLLNGAYGAAKVRGFQTEDPTRYDAVAACVKHFAAYGAGEGGRDYNRVDMSLQRLHEEYLPSYEACIKAGALSLMPAFNDINGEPCSSNHYLLTEVLREQWGFDGMVVSDANAVQELIFHGKAADKAHAAVLALEAGMDMDMGSGSFHEGLNDPDTRFSMAALDRAVADVLRLKFRLGLFENPFKTDAERAERDILTPENREIALEAARNSMVLLKNTGVLPLTGDEKVAVVGHLAKDRAEMVGTWALDGRGEDCVSLVDALEAREISHTWYKNWEAACAGDERIVIAAIGEQKEESGEAASKACLELSRQDMELIYGLKAHGKTVVAVLFNGRPLAIPELAELADGILEAWHPGVEAGNAIADVLYGVVNPCGKLTTTFPHASGQCPLYYAHPNTGRPAGNFKFTSKYQDAPIEPLYPFGYGLSYTHYDYSDLTASVTESGVDVSVTVANTGARQGAEIVQCYFRDPVASLVRPVKKLAAFQKVTLEAGQSKRISFHLPMDTFGFYDRNMQFVVEPGTIQIMVGRSCADVLTTDIEI